MKSKDKKFNLKNKIQLFIILSIILIGVLIYNHYLSENKVYAKNEENITKKEIEISNAKKINVDEIIQKNLQNDTEEKIIVEEEELEYLTKYENNNSLKKGEVRILQEGRKGTQIVTKKLTYQNGEVINEEVIKSKVKLAASMQIIEIGTGLGNTSKSGSRKRKSQP